MGFRYVGLENSAGIDVCAKHLTMKIRFVSKSTRYLERTAKITRKVREERETPGWKNAWKNLGGYKRGVSTPSFRHFIKHRPSCTHTQGGPGWSIRIRFKVRLRVSVRDRVRVRVRVRIMVRVRVNIRVRVRVRIIVRVRLRVTAEEVLPTNMRTTLAKSLLSHSLSRA